MATNETYALTTSGSWTVPVGVTSITVECFGSVAGTGFSYSQSTVQTKRDGASYSKSTSISVTAGQVFYHNIGSAGGNTWFNTVNSAPVVGTDTSATSCLAVGGSVTSTSQVAANIGNTKYAGGAGNVSTGSTVSGNGGNAGPNGAGANSGVPYSAISRNGSLIGSGGGGNGGSQGSLGVIPYGRTGSGVTPGAGNGGYWTGSVQVPQTADVTSSSNYLTNNPQTTSTNYGAFGGQYPDTGLTCCGGTCVPYYNSYPVAGFIIITLNSATQKTFGVGGVPSNNTSSGSFTVPADFVYLISIEAIGYGTQGNSSATTGGGGGGGGAYSYVAGSSVTASIVAGSTVVYYSVSGGNSASALDNWLRIGTNSAPSSVTDGVLAKGASQPVTSTGAAGGSAASGVGTTKNSGGTGGAGYVTSRNNAGGGGGVAGFNASGGTGGAGFTTTATRGSGGGGAANNAGVGSAGTNTAGGAGAAGSGTSGTGATSSVAATSGTNGGGGGGGFGTSFNGASGSIISTNGIYTLAAGGGGSNLFGGFGGGAPYSGAVLFTYSTVAAPAGNTGKFFLMF